MSKHQILHVHIKEYINKDNKTKKLLDNSKNSLPFLIINTKGVNPPEILGLLKVPVPRKQLEEVPMYRTEDPS